MSTVTHRRKIMLRQRRSSTRIARTVLMVSLIILLGRFVYSAVGAFLYHQEIQQQIRVEHSLDTSSVTAPAQRE
ncbi:DUF2633 family protein [Lonsdalea populi]|uniref:DUF2633 family protein n=1 Tax=Lonsdalea populi TaxID=1172565 RepID=A0A3N0USR0_9GAMM|nr:DUF2633 family protein [Lonsdalea populi]ROH83295.1 DUF2633 family protein [Lonsdalea populi]ROH83579.1 DUF2633 family protein [Lonsdalea populi]